MGLFGLTREYIWFALPITGFFIGKLLDDLETERMVSFRDKSCLFGGTKKEGDKPSWP